MINKYKICIDYYFKVIKNFKSKKVFYKYNKVSITYLDASQKLKKFLNFLNKKKNRGNIVIYCDKLI